MRPVREITAAEENFRIEPVPGAAFASIKRDPVEPEPVGTIILTAFRVTGYDKDCDGSLVARMEQIDKAGGVTGWNVDRIGLSPETELVVSQEELAGLFELASTLAEAGQVDGGD